MQAWVEKMSEGCKKKFGMNVPNDDIHFFLFIYYMHACACHSTHVEVRGTPCGYLSFHHGD